MERETRKNRRDNSSLNLSQEGLKVLGVGSLKPAPRIRKPTLSTDHPPPAHTETQSRARLGVIVSWRGGSVHLRLVVTLAKLQTL